MADILFKRILALVRTEARGRNIEVTFTDEHHQLLPFDITVTKELRPAVKSQKINGHFIPAKNDRAVENALSAAQEDQLRCLNYFTDVIRQQLDASVGAKQLQSSSETATHTGDRRFYRLHKCNNCTGLGHIFCNSCKGTANVVCPNCLGQCHVTCHCCNGGLVDCRSCGGSGREEFVDQHRDRHGHLHDCSYYVSCHSCGGSGDDQCGECGGSTLVSCRNCRAKGLVKCRTCKGLGKKGCKDCEASGRVGDIAHTEIHVTSVSDLALSQRSSQEFSLICGHLSAADVAGLADQFERVEISTKNNIVGAVVAKYKGQFRLATLDVRVNGKAYHIKAYGRQFTWGTTGGLVDDLIEQDLLDLESAIIGASRLRLLGHGDLIAPLRNFSNSEIHVELIKQLGHGKIHSRVVTPRYADRTTNAIHKTIRRIYLGLAAQCGLAAAAVISGLSVSSRFLIEAHTTVFTTASASMLIIATAYYAYKYRLNLVNKRMYGNEEIAEAGVQIGERIGLRRWAFSWLIVPGLSVSALLKIFGT